MKQANIHVTTGPLRAMTLRKMLTEPAIYLCAAIAFGALALGAIELTRGDGRIAMVWVPNAVAVAALLRRRNMRTLPLILAIWSGNVCANLIAGDALVTALALSSSNSIEILVAVTLVRRFVGKRPNMLEIKPLLGFVMLAGFVAPAISASFAVTALGDSGQFAASDWLKWMVTDGLGMILFAPSLMIFFDSIRDARKPTKREAAEWMILTAAGISITMAVFLHTDYPLLFLIYPVVLAHAFFLGGLGAAFSIFNIGIIAIGSTLNGAGPIHMADGSVEEGLVVLQVFLASAVIIGLPVAAMLNRQKRMLVDIEERKSQLALLADNMSDGVMRYNLAGICTYASASTADVLGQPIEVFVGKPAAADVHPDTREEIIAVQMRLTAGETDRERLTYRRVIDDDDARPVFIEADCVLVRDSESGAPETIIVSCRDISERVRLEESLKRARRHAENAAIAKSQFLANMSHEIRTPMNGVLGFAEILLQSELSEEQHRHTELIQESGKSMMRLLNDILDISKIEAGQITVSQERVVLADMLTNCRELLSANAAQKNIQLDERRAEELPECIMTDGLRVRQMILNLLGNAVKFTNSGRVVLDASVDQGMIVIAIEDSGIGIAPDHLESIFQPFEQADNTISRRFGGTGLGLSISRRLAELLGGTLTATSELEKGSRFELRIPLAVAESPAALAPTEIAVRDSSVPDISALVGGSRVLLAEDHEINSILIRAMLEKCGLNVCVAEDGALAVAAVMEAKAIGQPFQLVLMDIQMPECDGYTAARTIRELEMDADELPIVALTANAFAEDRIAARDAGMQGHLAKPLQFQALVEMLQQWLPTVPAAHPSVGESTQVPSIPVTSIPAPSPHTPAPASKSLDVKWRIRRREALDAVTAAIRENRLDGDAGAQLARTVHKLAGTAGMFGENRLGEKAGALERALKSGKPTQLREKFAQELLDAA